jgi:hypothetical protein
MSVTHDSTAAPACKAPRDRILRLHVEAELCPQVMLRVLDLLSRQALLPLAIAAERGDDHIRMEIDLEGDLLSEPRDALLIDKVEAIVMVRGARLESP